MDTIPNNSICTQLTIQPYVPPEFFLRNISGT